MKVSIKNLGVIRSADIKISPLTVFVGANNTGKTWVAYTLASILSSFGWRKHKQAYISGAKDYAFSELEDIVERIVEEGNAKIDVVQFAEAYGSEYFNQVAQLSKGWMREFMGTQRVQFDNLEISIDLKLIQSRLLTRVKGFKADGGFSVGAKGALISAIKEKENSELFFYTTSDRDALAQFPARAVREFVIDVIFSLLHRAIYYDVYTFPTERTAIIALPIVRAERSSVKSEDTFEVSSVQAAHSSILSSEVITRFLGTIYRSLDIDYVDRQRMAREIPQISQYIQLSRVLEKNILGGDIDFSLPEPGRVPEILYHPNSDDTLEIHITSSMVKELSPLVLYLRYLAEPGDWLIIDEPEMNLHPRAQAQLIEFLSLLVDAGLSILITTHSPYFVDHLSNLIKATDHKNGAEILDKFYLKQQEAFISKDHVSVYLFKNGTAKDILEIDGSIDWGTFGDISDQISEVQFQLD